MKCYTWDIISSTQKRCFLIDSWSQHTAGSARTFTRQLGKSFSCTAEATGQWTHATVWNKMCFLQKYSIWPEGNTGQELKDIISTLQSKDVIWGELNGGARKLPPPSGHSSSFQQGHLTQKCWHPRAAVANQSPGPPVQASVVPLTGTCHQTRHIKPKWCYPSFQQSTDQELPVLGTQNASKNINTLKLLHWLF